MRNIRLPRPTLLGWCAAVGIAAASGTAMFLALRNPIIAVLVGALGAAAFVLAGAPPEPKDVSASASPEPELLPAPVRVPAPRAEAVPAPQPAMVAAAAEPSPLADPLDQVSLLSAYLQDESSGYQPSFVPQQPTLVARVPGQTLTATEPDPLADAFASAPAQVIAEPVGADSWRMGIDILPQSRSSAAAVGNRLGSFRSAVVSARREAKPKPLPGRHRAG